MKNYIYSIFACLVLAVLPSCLSQRARDQGLLPAARMAWVGVQADVELGIEVSALTDGASVALIREYSSRIDDGLQTGDRSTLSLVSLETISAYAERGIQERIRRGEISEGVAVSFRERLKNFVWAIAKLQQQYVYMEPPREREYWLPNGVRSTPEAAAAAGAF